MPNWRKQQARLRDDERRKRIEGGRAEAQQVQADPATPRLKVVALPGDRDLDIDFHDVTVSGVIRLDYEFVITMAGGFGRWADDNGEMVDIDSIDQMDIAFGRSQATDESLRLFHDRLAGWANDGTQLRFVGAPGRCFLLLDESTVGVAGGAACLPIPRDL